jgi:ribonuclease HI
VTQPSPVLHIHIDGGSRGNPGDAGFGVHVATPEGETVAGLYGYLGRATNNVAEYQALIHALRYALAQGASRVKLFSDSELVVRQMEGRYKVKHPDMIPLHREAKSLLGRFGELAMDGQTITAFHEKPEKEAGFISGGFFVLNKRIGEYIEGDSTVLEKKPLERLTQERQLKAYCHDGFWQCMDTLRDLRYLESLWQSGHAPWKTW